MFLESLSWRYIGLGNLDEAVKVGGYTRPVVCEDLFSCGYWIKASREPYAALTCSLVDDEC